MSLLDLLQVGYRGVTAQQFLTEVAGQNITNASTPGYRRQTGVLEAMQTVPGATLQGVRASAVLQARDAFLQKELATSGSELGQEQAMRETLEAVEPYMSELDGNGLGSALDALFRGFGKMSEDPSSLAVRNEVLAAGGELASRIRQVATALESARSESDQQLAASVGDVNGSLGRIAELNRAIARREGAGDSAATLRDERDGLVQDVAGALGLQSFEESDGSVTLLTAGGQALVQGEVAATLSLATPTGGGHPVVQVGHTGEPAADLRGPVGGRIGGLLAARDGALTSALDGLDQLAFDLAGNVNAAHSAGFGLDGATGRRFFVPLATASGAATALSLSTDVAGQPQALAASGSLAGVPGDNTVALTLADLARQAIFGSGSETPADALNGVGNGLAQRLADARAGEEAQTAVRGRVEQLHASRTGVSIEEELVNVTAAQRAFEASARTIRVADELLQRVLQL